MYVKTTTRRNKDGTPVRYLHLAHNQWDQAAGRSVPKILYGLGREDQLDRAAIKRLVASLSGLLEPADALAATAGAGLHFVESRPLGGAYVLDGLWHRLGIDKVMANLLSGRRLDPRVDACCSAWSPTGHCSPPPSWPPRPGSPMTWQSTACPGPATMRATGQWTGCWRSPTRWRRRSSGRSRPCLTLKSTCCSSTRPRPTSSWTSPTSRWPATSAAVPCPRQATPVRVTARPRRGSAATASPRTTVTTC